MKPAFTLIEVIISLVLLSMIIVFSYKAIDGLKKSNGFYQKRFDKEVIKYKIKKELFYDIFGSFSISVKKGSHYDTLDIVSDNSNFGIIRPHIRYEVKDKTLYRVESPRNFPKRVDEGFLKYIKFEIVLKNVKKFKAFVSSSGVLIRLNDMIYEVGR